MADYGVTDDGGPWKGPSVYQEGRGCECGKGDDASCGRRPRENSGKAEKNHEGADGAVGRGGGRRGTELAEIDDADIKEGRGCT